MHLSPGLFSRGGRNQRALKTRKVCASDKKGWRLSSVFPSLLQHELRRGIAQGKRNRREEDSHDIWTHATPVFTTAHSLCTVPPQQSPSRQNFNTWPTAPKTLYRLGCWWTVAGTVITFQSNNYSIDSWYRFYDVESRHSSDAPKDWFEVKMMWRGR